MFGPPPRRKVRRDPPIHIRLQEIVLVAGGRFLGCAAP
jgi:hypothetical protein